MNRRDFIKFVGFGIAAGSVAGCSSSISGTNQRPNILLILTDDMGFSDLGCYGSEIDTPNLDMLAEGGLRFTQFYNAARCCPTRASLLTGLYPHQAGIGFMTGDQGYDSYRGKLNDRCVTIAEALKLSGYRTLMSGKWHVGDARGHWPVDRGFDRYFGLLSGACSYWELMPGRKMAKDDQEWKPDPENDKFYMTDAFTDNAVDMLDEYGHENKPFFMYLAYTAPHWPLHAWPEDIAKYRGKYMIGWDELRKRRHKRMKELGIVDEKWPLSPRHEKVPAWEEVKNKDEHDLRMAVYAAMIDRMDQGIGKVIDKIKSLGKLDNTLIMFLSDNGACHVMVNRGKPGIPPGPKGGYWGYDYHWANAGNTPLRKFKQKTHEGGIATPLIAHWPKGIKHKNMITHQKGHIIDIMTTCLDVAGADYPKTNNGQSIKPMEGLSLKPIFDGNKRQGHEYIFWEHMGNKAVRYGKWKLVMYHGDAWELYDIEADRTEQDNLISKHSDMADNLKQEYNKWADRCGVKPWPIKKKKAKT